MLRTNDDYQIANTKSEQLRDLLPLIFSKSGSQHEPLESLAIELIEDIAHAVRRLN